MKNFSFLLFSIFFKLYTCKCHIFNFTIIIIKEILPKNKFNNFGLYIIVNS